MSKNNKNFNSVFANVITKKHKTKICENQNCIYEKTFVFILFNISTLQKYRFSQMILFSQTIDTFS